MGFRVTLHSLTYVDWKAATEVKRVTTSAAMTSHVTRFVAPRPETITPAFERNMSPSPNELAEDIAGCRHHASEFNLVSRMLKYLKGQCGYTKMRNIKTLACEERTRIPTTDEGYERLASLDDRSKETYV